MSEWTKEEYEGSDTLVQEINLEEIESSGIAELRQEGNYLIGITDKGVRFRQHIPTNKILDKVNGKYVLRDIAI